MPINVIVNKENIVQRLSRNRLNDYSIETFLFIPSIDNVDDSERGLKEFPLSLKQAIGISRRLREGKEVMLNPIPDYFNRIDWHYSVYIDGKLTGVLER